MKTGLVIIASCLWLSAYGTVITREAETLTGQALVDYINHQGQWTAKFNEHSDRNTLSKVARSAKKSSFKSVIPEELLSGDEIPKAFDARTQWPECQSIRAIRDQSNCGSCWAFGAVEAMSDRICIASKGKKQVTLSADDLLSCCKDCGHGCDGGFSIAAWQYWVDTGIVTGSGKEEGTGCRPYPFERCEHHTNKTHYKPCDHDQLFPTPKCSRECQESYKKPYEEDKWYGKSVYSFDGNIEAIQRDLMTNGPLEVSLDVYEDFEHYSGGIYRHLAGAHLGGHAIKLLGWGEENGTPFWILQNSWNEDWGEDGYVRMVRGVDECGIEDQVVGGIPKL